MKIRVLRAHINLVKYRQTGSGPLKNFKFENETGTTIKRQSRVAKQLLGVSPVRSTGEERVLPQQNTMAIRLPQQTIAVASATNGEAVATATAE